MKRLITLLALLLAFTILAMPTYAKPPNTPDPSEMPVQVTNDASNPVPVEVTNQSTCTKEPVQYDGTGSRGDNKLEVSFIMPNYRDIEYVVIEQVTLYSFAPETHKVTNVSIQSKTMDDVTVTHYLTYQELCHDCTIPVTGYPALTNKNIFNVSQQTRIYAKPGSTVWVKIYFDNYLAPNESSMKASISGYEVSMGCSD